MKRQATSTPVRKNFQKKPKTTASTFAQAKRIGADAGKGTKSELKFIDNSLGPLAVVAATNNWTLQALLNGVQSGSTATTRIGRKMVMKSILLRYSASLAATSTGGSPVRVLVVYDKQANAAAPAITDILLADDFESPNNLSNRDRFVTIFDHITQPISIQNNYSVADTLYKKLNLETMFNTGSAGTIADITSGSVYLLTSQDGSIGTANASIQLYTRIRFDDV